MQGERKDTPGNGYKAPAVHKAFKLLRMIAEAPHGLRLVELAERLGISKSTTHGLVHALLREKALIQRGDGHELYLGPLIADLAFTDWNYVKVNKIAQPTLNEVRDAAEATVFLGVRIRNRVLITATAEAVQALKISAPVGTAIPILAGAVGKVFLAREPEEDVRGLISELGLPQYTQKSIVKLDDYLAELGRVGSQGYAIDDEEYLSGIRAIAVALHNLRGLPMAIWVVGIAGSLMPSRLRQVAEMTVLSARKLRSLLEEPNSKAGAPLAATG
jgi:DNA-binding IclR family transcriptional regulator